jgi:hypothetical protein
MIRYMQFISINQSMCDLVDSRISEFVFIHGEIQYWPVLCFLLRKSYVYFQQDIASAQTTELDVSTTDYFGHMNNHYIFHVP